jgi:hypothetical protein
MDVGFTDRFKEAAEAARAKLQEHGVIHDADAIHGVHAVDARSHDIDVAKRAMALGAPDPYSMITHDEVVALTGIPVGGPSLTYTDDDLGVRFDAEDGHRRTWSFAVHAGHGLTVRNVAAVARIPEVEELNIGHSIVSRSVFVGIAEAVREMRRAMQAGRDAGPR